MMDIMEKSKEYAKGRAFKAMTAAIEQAYADGYNDGMKHIENEKLEAMKDGVEYKDLKLPSGTKWSSTYLYNRIEQPDLMTYMENLIYQQRSNLRSYALTVLSISSWKRRRIESSLQELTGKS